MLLRQTNCGMKHLTSKLILSFVPARVEINTTYPIVPSQGTTGNMEAALTPTAPPADRAKRFARHGKFRLIDLPPELRNVIYYFALTNEQALRLKRREPRKMPRGGRVFPLRQVCKTTY